jgi:endo-1,4-beta-xylanase
MTLLQRRSVLAGILATAAMAGASRSAGAVAAELDSLKAAADRKGLSFGSAIDPQLLGDPNYVQLILAQCDTIVPRNSLKWNATERSPGRFDFGEADKVIRFAQQQRLAVRGTTLVWYRSPTWVGRLKTSEAVSDAMTRHIATVMGRYAGKIASWDVVNEPFEYDKPQQRKSVFLDKLGEQYFDVAFGAARAADPKCQLVLNETHLYEAGDVYSAKRAAVLALLDRLLARKVPIDAVGVQGHVRPGLDKVDAEGFGGFCRDLKSRGLAVLLTELDASCRYIKRVPGFTPAGYGTPLADLVSIAHANGKLTSVISWGMSPYGLKPNEGTGPGNSCQYRVNLFDNDLKPLPTFDALRNSFDDLRS